ncbi:helix-turn-helix domain-containing protein, partial [bacterium]|nr:helix-turn-helix domain-containing protein [bacterium]
DVRSIRKLLSEGIKQKKIAKKFKISEMQITRIKRHDNWKDV